MITGSALLAAMFLAVGASNGKVVSGESASNPNGRSECFEEAQVLTIRINCDAWDDYGCGMA